MKLSLRFCAFLALGAVVACSASTPDTVSEDLALGAGSASSSLFAGRGWTGDFVATTARPEGFPGRLRGVSLALDPSNPAMGGRYTVYYRSGNRVDGTFSWSVPPTSTRAVMTFHAEIERDVTLTRNVGAHSIMSEGLDSAADPTGEAYDTVVEPLQPGLCATARCAPHENCVDAAFEPNAVVRSHACVAKPNGLMAFE
jgi:hypothetical protein